MCGIAGIFGRTPPEGLAGRLLAVLRHRGPDGAGTFRDEECLLVHARLAILDLTETGAQPMASEDGEVRSVLNGEIYNFRELRGQLGAAGHVFRGSSDAEVVPHACEQWGEAFVERLEGMFAIALYDRRRQRLLLARDRVGVKPLYYAEVSGGLIFGSEIKAVLAWDAVPRETDAQALRDYLALTYVPEPATAYKAVRVLPPGCALTRTEERTAVRRYWTPDLNPVPIQPGEAAEKLAGMLDRAVARQLVADVPVGAMLSGGLDSSNVVASACRAAAGPLRTFTVRFPASSHDESALARRVAERCGTRHEEVPADERSLSADTILSLLRHFDQPFGDSSLLPTYLLSAAMRRHVKAAMSGDGGDEVFSGYRRFTYLPRLLKLARRPAALLKAVRGVSRAIGPIAPDLSRLVRTGASLAQTKDPRAIATFFLVALPEEDLRRLAPDLRGETASRLFTDEWVPAGLSSEDAAHAFLTANCLRVGLPGDMLRKVDMMSMKAGLEVRVPMLDEEVVRFGLSLPRKVRHDGRHGKVCLRRIARLRLPPEVAEGGKRGFEIPLHDPAYGGYRALVRELLASGRPRIADVCRETAYRPWVDAFLAGRAPRAEMSQYALNGRVFSLLALEAFLRGE